MRTFRNTQINVFEKSFALLFYMLVFCINNGFSQKYSNPPSENQSKSKDVQYFRSPSVWIQSKLDMMNKIERSVLTEIDTSYFNEKLAEFRLTLETIFSNIPELESNPNLRRYYNVRNQLNKLNEDIGDEIRIVRTYTNELFFQLEGLNEVRTDSVLENRVKDSSVAKTYAEEFKLLNLKLGELDVFCKTKLDGYVRLEKSFNELSISSIKSRTRLTADINVIRKNLLHAEEPPIWSMGSKKYPPFADVAVHTSKIKYRTLLDYTKSSLFELIFMRILVFIFALLPVWYMRKIFKQGPETEYTRNFKYIHKHTAYLAAPTILIFAPFLFHYPPLLFLDILFVSLIIAVTFIILKDIPTLNKKFVISLLVYYVLLKLLNVFVQVTIFERVLYSLSILIVPRAFIFYRRVFNHSIRYKSLMRAMIAFCIIHIFVGWIFCCLGNFLLGKLLILSGLDGFFFILILFYAINGINDYILMSGDYLHRKFSGFRPNLVLFMEKLMPYLVFFAAIFWFVAYLVNINYFEAVSANFNHFLLQTRFIGEISYSFNNVAIFIVFSIGGIIFSNLLKALLDREGPDTLEKHEKWENYLFVIRLLIIVGGFVLGINAAGIEMKNIAVLLGALGVGLGFGLQHIFNNLVSGLLIAFERPFKIGDILTLPEGSGRVKEIGLRSSILVTGEGAEIIVPNGNLISNSFSNWTLTNKRKRLTIPLQVSRDADITIVKEILEKAAQNTNGILLIPAPQVNMKAFTENSLVFELECWVGNMKEGESIRSRVNEKIAEELKVHQIGTPALMQRVIINDLNK